MCVCLTACSVLHCTCDGSGCISIAACCVCGCVVVYVAMLLCMWLCCCVCGDVVVVPHVGWNGTRTEKSLCQVWNT